MRVIAPIEVDFARDLRRGVCSFCRRVVGRNGFVELYSLIGTRLVYPNGFEPVALLSHTRCGPDTGYAIEIKGLRGNIDSKHGWMNHLREKGWCCQRYLDAVRQAAKLSGSREGGR